MQIGTAFSVILEHECNSDDFAELRLSTAMNDPASFAWSRLLEGWLVVRWCLVSSDFVSCFVNIF